ncbi:hypothetical protein GCM10020219_000860 [Nonomuraea dietziae]
MSPGLPEISSRQGLAVGEVQVQHVELVQRQQVDDLLDLVDGEEPAHHVQGQPAPAQGGPVEDAHAGGHEPRLLSCQQLREGRRATEQPLGRGGRHRGRPLADRQLVAFARLGLLVQRVEAAGHDQALEAPVLVVEDEEQVGLAGDLDRRLHVVQQGEQPGHDLTELEQVDGGHSDTRPALQPERGRYGDDPLRVGDERRGRRHGAPCVTK